MTVLQVCAFAAPNAGNFIASLTQLEKKLTQKGIKTIYAFADGAVDKLWCQEIQKRTMVYFLPTAKARVLPKTYWMFRKIYRENNITIVHCHFELYDIPATITAPRHSKVFWHLHDPIQIGNGIRAMIWRLQYGVVGKHAQLLAVADHYRREIIKLGFPEHQTQNVLNSIDLTRISPCKTVKNKEFDFLTFGWDFYRKGDDLIIKACDRLEREGYHFKLLLNGNETTWIQLKKHLCGRWPAYLVKGLPAKDVNSLFEKSKVFIQASRQETFSYAVCEAAYAGLPVISSDIDGLEWAHALPSVQFFPSENDNILYMHMKRFLDGETISDSLILQSRKVIQSTYSLDVWTEKIVDIYHL